MAKSFTTREKALEALEPLANLLCQSHPHELFVTDSAPGQTVEGYSMGIECGKDNIIWTVKMGENRRFRSLMRSRRVVVLNDNTKSRAKTLFQIDKVWRGQVCDQLLSLHSLGKLKENWWEYPMVVSNDRDSSDYTNRGHSCDCPQRGAGAIESAHRGPRGVIYVTCSPLTTRLCTSLSWELPDPPSTMPCIARIVNEAGKGEEEEGCNGEEETGGEGGDFDEDDENEGDESNEAEYATDGESLTEW